MQGGEPPEALTLYEVRLACLRDVSKRELRLGESLVGHQELLLWDGKPLALQGVSGVFHGHYQGYECLLIVCALQPHCAAIFFVDAETGCSLRPPAIAPCSVTDPTLIAVRKREFLVCRAWRAEGSVLVFDVTDHLRAQAAMPCDEFGGYVQSLKPMAPGRLLAAAGSRHEDAYIGIVDFTGGRPRFERGPTMEGAPEDALWMPRG